MSFSRFFVFATLLTTVAVSDAFTSEAPAPPAPAFSAGDIVTFKPKYPGCYSPGWLETISEALQANSDDILEQYLTAEPNSEDGPRCLLLSDKLRFRFVQFELQSLQASTAIVEDPATSLRLWVPASALLSRVAPSVTSEASKPKSPDATPALQKTTAQKASALSELELPKIDSPITVRIDPNVQVVSSETTPTGEQLAKGESRKVLADGTVLVGIFKGAVFVSGTVTLPDKTILNGRFTDYYSGVGSITFADGRKASGEFKDATLNGAGELQLPDGTVLSGFFKNGVLNGDGKIKTPSGAMFVGQFVNNKLAGAGSITFPNKDTSTGIYREGRLNGKGKIVRASGLVSEGTFVENRLNGYGTLQTPEATFTGLFVDDELTGDGVAVYSNGIQAKGAFERNLLNGHGIIRYPDSAVLIGDFRDNHVLGVATVSYPDTRTYSGRVEDTDATIGLPNEDIN